MKAESTGIVIGISIGVVIGVLLAFVALFSFRCQRKRSRIANSSSRRASTIPFREYGMDSCTAASDASVGTDSPKSTIQQPFWLRSNKANKPNMVIASGLLHYSYRDLQKATLNFTTLIGKGAYGHVYKAHMSTGETVAVKVLAVDSKQGEKEFLNEVTLLGRLHHRNLVNLVGYCAEKGQHILIYVYMRRGSLAAHLYNEDQMAKPLSWDLRVQIALDVAKGMEYLHDGAVPPVIHRDIKSSNILLDQSMRARVADFGLSREEMVNKHVSNLRGTFGYLDPEYISTRTFTKKSDVYSYGVLLFELVAGRNPLQGLMEHVELAAMNTEGKVGWEEIIDSRLDGKFDLQEVNDMAALAYKCVERVAKKRPSMREVVQVLSRILQMRRQNNLHKKTSSATSDDFCVNMDQLEHGNSNTILGDKQMDQKKRKKYNYQIDFLRVPQWCHHHWPLSKEWSLHLSYQNAQLGNIFHLLSLSWNHCCSMMIVPQPSKLSLISFCQNTSSPCSLNSSFYNLMVSCLQMVLGSQL